MKHLACFVTALCLMPPMGGASAQQAEGAVPLIRHEEVMCDRSLHVPRFFILRPYMRNDEEAASEAATSLSKAEDEEPGTCVVGTFAYYEEAVEPHSHRLRDAILTVGKVFVVAILCSVYDKPGATEWVAMTSTLEQYIPR